MEYRASTNHHLIQPADNDAIAQKRTNSVESREWNADAVGDTIVGKTKIAGRVPFVD